MPPSKKYPSMQDVQVVEFKQDPHPSEQSRRENEVMSNVEDRHVSHVDKLHLL
jgi:hypothetical protein